MKISARQYAESLMDSVSAKSDSETSEVLDNFAKMMMENRDLNRLDEVLAAFSKIWDQAQGELTVEFISARTVSTDVKSSLEKYLQAKTGANKVVLVEKINPEILGGFILRYEDQIIDASLKSSLGSLKNEMNK